MPFYSGRHQAAAADTAEPIDANAHQFFNYGWITLDPAATGPAYFGGPEVKVTTAIGARINPGATVLIPPTDAPSPYNTKTFFVAFTDFAVAADMISFTVFY